MSQSSVAAKLDPEQINELARNFWYSAVLRAGIKLDVFSLLENESLTADAVAQHISASPKFVHAFLDSCAVLDLLKKKGNKYTNSPLSSKFLVKTQQTYVGDHALHHTNTWASWGRLDEIIKEGKTILPYEAGYVDADTYWTDYMLGQHNRATSGQGEQLVQNVDLKNKRKLIDLGGGAASYSIALCAANPKLKSVVVDRKEPLNIARPLVEEANLQDRITLLEGDVFETDLGTGYDVALVSGVVLITAAEASIRLFKLAHKLLVPGGMIIVQDYMRIDQSSEREKLDTMENLYVLVAFDPDAGDRDGEEVASWLRDTEFINTKLIPLPTQLALIRGTCYVLQRYCRQ